MANNITALVNFSALSPVCKISALNDTFPRDQLHISNDACEVYLCGCLLNHTQLLEQNQCAELSTLIPLLYHKHKQEIIKVLKGSYTLLFFDKTVGSIFVSNDLLSKKPLYYHCSGSFFAVSNRFSELAQLLVDNDIPLEIDKLAATMMLSEGFLWDDVTWAKGVKYLRPFEYITADKNGCVLCSLESSFDTTFGGNSIAYSDAVEKFHSLFKTAVQLQCQKTVSGGHSFLASLSAGMDTRATVLSAYELGYKDITCFTYAQSGSVDDSISKKIASDYNLNHIFYQLDNARFLLDIDSTFELNEGEQTYCGATGANSVSELLEGAKYGIIHTGSLGGELMGDVQFSPHKTPVKDNLSHTTAAKALGQEEILQRYSLIMQKYSCNQQLELQKHLRACQNFSHITSRKFQSLSPFLDEDVYLFLASLPPEYKQERRLYAHWMSKHLPNDYITTYMYGRAKSNGLLRKAKYALRILKGKLFGKSRYDMNPFDYWAKTMPTLVNRLREQLALYLENVDGTGVSIAPILKAQISTASLDTLVKAITTAKAVSLIDSLKKTGE